MQSSLRLSFDDLNIPCKEMALYLLNKVLVRKLDNGLILKGRIVETECYPGGEDKASRSFRGKQTPGNAPMFMAPGTAFVYMTYGMYHCFNISSLEPGGAVLIRALEPLSGHEEMRKFRLLKRATGKQLKDTELCNGPSKLCMSLNITRDLNKIDMCTSDEFWLEDNDEVNKDSDNDDDLKIIKTSRVGIASAGVEWASKPLRFYVFENTFVSKRDKTAEKDFAINV